MNKTLLAAAAAAISLTGQPAAFADGGHHDNARANQIVGLWSTEVTLRNCATGDVAPVPNPIFLAVNTFHKGGTLTEDGARFSPALRNTGQGVWQRTGRRTFESRMLFHLFDANGLFTGTQDIWRTLTLAPDGQSFTASASVTITRPGLPTITGCATEVAERVEL